MFDKLGRLMKIAKSKSPVGETLNFILEHSDKIEGVVVVILNKHHDAAKRVLGKLEPTTREGLINLLKESGLVPISAVPNYVARTNE